jgi:sodium-coupled neutral amino acid transporter 11
MFSYPLECFVCRDVIKNTFFEETKNEKFVHFAVTIGLSIATVSLSFLTDCLGVVLEINVTFIVIFLVF